MPPVIHLPPTEPDAIPRAPENIGRGRTALRPRRRVRAANANRVRLDPGLAVAPGLTVALPPREPDAVTRQPEHIRRASIFQFSSVGGRAGHAGTLPQPLSSVAPNRKPQIRERLG